MKIIMVSTVIAAVMIIVTAALGAHLYRWEIIAMSAATIFEQEKRGGKE